MSLVIKLIMLTTIALSAHAENKRGRRICSLDEMRRFAAEACEGLFQNDIRNLHKREISHRRHGNHENDIMSQIEKEDALHTRKVKVIHRVLFPKHGYLVLEHQHATRLNDYDSDYLIQELSHRRSRSHNHHNVERRKRQSNSKIEVSYCCLQQCEYEHFC